MINCVQQAENSLESAIRYCYAAWATSTLPTWSTTWSFSPKVWSSRQTKMAPCRPTLCTKLDKTPALLRRPMKSDVPTGVLDPTQGGNSTSSMVLCGSKVRDQNAWFLNVYTGIYYSTIEYGLIHYLGLIWFIGLCRRTPVLDSLFSLVYRWQ